MEARRKSNRVTDRKLKVQQVQQPLQKIKSGQSLYEEVQMFASAIGFDSGKSSIFGTGHKGGAVGVQSGSQSISSSSSSPSSMLEQQDSSSLVFNTEKTLPEAKLFEFFQWDSSELFEDQFKVRTNDEVDEDVLIGAISNATNISNRPTVEQLRETHMEAWRIADQNYIDRLKLKYAQCDEFLNDLIANIKKNQQNAQKKR